jgi:hypothetical protein
MPSSAMSSPTRREFLAALAAAGVAVDARVDVPALALRVAAAIRDHGEGMDASCWLGSPQAAWFTRHAETARPTASAIKTFYLVELFDAHRGRLDAPLAGTAAVLDDAHPAISHFEPAQRDEIRRELSGATVRRVGEVMMGTAPASNAVYNAAANLTTAVLGGPEALTARIRRREAAFAPVAARRYMLRDRKAHGDNEASSGALAALYQRLADRRLSSLDAPTHDAVRAAMRRPDDPVLGRHFDKDGNLPSDPLAEVRAGWYEGQKGAMIYVVMATQPAPGPAGREASSQRLSKTATAIAGALTSAAR